MNVLAILVTSAVFTSSIVNATLDPKAPRGVQAVEIPVPGRNSELCFIPQHFEGGAYSKKDFSREQELCGLGAGINAAVCPKDNSTNPGVTFFNVPDGTTPKSIEDADCDKKKIKGLKKLAKYKLSTSCSYTPAILGYYHISRILGGVGGVPPSVLRTYDKQNQIALLPKAERMADGDLIRQKWRFLVSHLKQGVKSSRRDLLMTDDFSQSYGALIRNPRNEFFYDDFFPKVSKGDNMGLRRAQAFARGKLVSLLATPKPVAELVGREFTPKNLQLMMQLKDASDMMIMDTLLNQQDRYGNIEAELRYYYFDPTDPNPDGTPNMKSATKLTAEEVSRLGAVQIKKIVLKDNDCGVAKDNIAKKAGLDQRVGHMDPETYQRLLALDAVADEPKTSLFFKNELMFTAEDFSGFRNNLKGLVLLLRDKCAKNMMKPDLDLEAHFSNQAPLNITCESVINRE